MSRSKRRLSSTFSPVILSVVREFHERTQSKDPVEFQFRGVTRPCKSPVKLAGKVAIATGCISRPSKLGPPRRLGASTAHASGTRALRSRCVLQLSFYARNNPVSPRHKSNPEIFCALCVRSGSDFPGTWRTRCAWAKKCAGACRMTKRPRCSPQNKSQSSQHLRMRKD